MRWMLSLLAALVAVGCEPAGGELVKSGKARASATAPQGDVEKLTLDNLAFGLDAYSWIADREENFVFSPHSVSIALAMTSAGARGATLDEMRDALRFELEASKLHAAFNTVDQALASRNQHVELRSVNQLWGQRGRRFEQPFLDTLAVSYGTGMRLLDFIRNPEPSRQEINEWVAWHTKEKISELIPRGSIDSLTRLVLTNAIFLDARWKDAFDPDRTKDRGFTLLDGSSVSVPYMNGTIEARVAHTEEFTAIEVPYQGDELGLLVIMPRPGAFEPTEAALTAEVIADVAARLTEVEVVLWMPRFREQTQLALVPFLESLGMRTAFGDGADFTGMLSDEPLSITDVVHEAVIDVSEEGTEAAAATAVVIGGRSAASGPPSVVIDRPYMFLIRDRPTGAVLFLGRVLDPSAT